MIVFLTYMNLMIELKKYKNGNNYWEFLLLNIILLLM